LKYSVIIPVGERHADAVRLHNDYQRGLALLGGDYEIIYVLDGPRPAFAAGLQQLLATGERFTVLGLSRSFGESTAIMAAFARSSGTTIITQTAM
jgi:hypothetical protein